MSLKEWISLKKNVFNYKDFPEFKNDYFNEVREHNQKIDHKLEDIQTQKELDLLINQCTISERIRQYVNPFYIDSKYEKYSQVRIKKKSFLIKFFYWIASILRN